MTGEDFGVRVIVGLMALVLLAVVVRWVYWLVVDPIWTTRYTLSHVVGLLVIGVFLYALDRILEGRKKRVR